MLRSMPRSLWLDWLAFFELEPWGGPTEDLRAGYLLSLTHACHTGKTREPGEWFPSLRVERKPLSAELQKAMWKAYAGSRPGGVVR